MHFYSPSPLSMGYIPRRSYRPEHYLDEESPSALSFEGLHYHTSPYTFSAPSDAETRYRRALHELHAAEEEFEAHLTLRRARRAAILSEQAARRERALALQAEVERIERARALQARLAEEYELHQRAHQAQAARRHNHPVLHPYPFASERPCSFARKRLTHSEPVHRPVLHDNEVTPLDGLLRLISGAHAELHSPLQQYSSRAPAQPRSSEPQSTEKQDATVDPVSAVLDFLHGPHQRHSSPAPAQPLSAEPQSSEKQDVAVDPVSAVLEFLHGLVAHAKDAANESETIPKPIPVPQPQAKPAEEKGKGKAKAERTEPPTGLTLLQALFGGPARGSSDQELSDIELAIKRSLEDRDAADAKKAAAAKVARSTSGASSSRVKLDVTAPPSNTPSSASNVTSATPTPVPGPVSPLTTIRAVRNQLSALESAFKFPAVIDFDHSVLAVSPNNAPMRTYESSLNGLLEQLDAIESDGDEEVRSTRREVVREVEKALEDLERKVSEKAPKPEVIKGAEVKGYNVEAEEPKPSVSQGTVPVEATSGAQGAKTTESSAAASPGEVDVDLAIYEEYVASTPDVSPSNSANPDRSNTAAQTVDDAFALDTDETAPALGDSSESVATITATSASGPSSDVYVPALPSPETFLASMSHDQFTFPPQPSYSESGTVRASAQDDAELVMEGSEEGGSVKSGEDGWSEVDA